MSKEDQSTGERDSLPSWARGSRHEACWGKQLPDGLQSSQHSLILHYSLLLSPPPFHTLLPSNYAPKPRNSTRCVSKAVLPVSGQGGGSQGTETQWRGCARFPDPSLICSHPSPHCSSGRTGRQCPRGTNWGVQAGVPTISSSPGSLKLVSCPRRICSG